MWHVALAQLETSPGWVGPTIAISLAILALVFIGMGLAVGIAALRVAAEVRKLGLVIESVQGDALEAVKAVRRIAEQGQDMMVMVRHEAGAFAHAGRRLRRKVMRGADRVEQKLHNLETLYDVVHDEVEDTVLNVAAAFRSVRQGNGVLNRIRRFVAWSRNRR